MFFLFAKTVYGRLYWHIKFADLSVRHRNKSPLLFVDILSSSPTRPAALTLASTGSITSSSTGGTGGHISYSWMLDWGLHRLGCGRDKSVFLHLRQDYVDLYKEIFQFSNLLIIFLQISCVISNFLWTKFISFMGKRTTCCKVH